MLPDSLRRRFERQPDLIRILDNMGWLLVDKAVRMSVGLFVGVWLARYLGPEQFGSLSYAIAFVGLFGAFAELGLSGIVVRDIVRDPESAPATLASAFLMQLSGALLAIFLINASLLWISPDDLLIRTLVAILSVSLVFKSADVVKYWFESQVKSRYSVWIENAALVLMACVRVFLIVTGASLTAFVWASLLEAALVGFGLVAIYVAKHGDIKSWRPRIARMKSLLAESWSLMLAGLAVTLYMRLDLLMLQEMVGYHEAGIYAAATKISEIWYFLPVVIAASVSPSLILSRRADTDQYLNRLRNLYFVLTWLGIGISIPMGLLSSSIIGILYGEKFAEAAPVLAIHLWASIAVFLGVASSQYLLIENLQRISLYRTVIGLASNIALNLLLIPQLGAAGAAIATVISYFISVFSLLFFKNSRNHAGFMLRAAFRKD